MMKCRVCSSVTGVILVLTIAPTLAAQTSLPPAWSSYESTASTAYDPPVTTPYSSVPSNISPYSEIPPYSPPVTHPEYPVTSYPAYPASGSGATGYDPSPYAYPAVGPYGSSLPSDPAYETSPAVLAPRTAAETTDLAGWPAVPPPPAAPPLDLPEQDPTDDSPETLEPIPEPVAPVLVTPSMQPVEYVDLWDMSIELGVSGSEGNSETANVRAGFDATRKTDRNKLVVDFDYKRDTTDKIETVHRMLLDLRDDILFADSPWSLFGHGLTEYDEFLDFDARIAADMGVGYQFLETDLTTIGGSLGAGFSKEIESPNDDFVPEAVMGLELEHQLTERQKLIASSSYTPDMTGFADFRLKTKVDWEVLLDDETNLSLKFSILDRYDSTPGTAKPNDLDYSMVFLWKF